MKKSRNQHPSSSKDARLSLQQLFLMTGFFGVLALSLEASQPAWWTASGGPLNSHASNDSEIVNQGQLKQFTEKGVNYLNAHLTNGAGSSLNGLLTTWSNYYQVHGYSATNHPPVDYREMNSGQLKYIAHLMYDRLSAEGYMSSNYPAWTKTNSSDYKVASIGQLKQVFAFEAAIPQTPVNLDVDFGGTTATIYWSDPVLNVQNFTIQVQIAGSGTWSDLSTVTGGNSSMLVTGLVLGTNYLFRVKASNGAGTSAPSTSDAAPIITLSSPSGATLVP